MKQRGMKCQAKLTMVQIKMAVPSVAMRKSTTHSQKKRKRLQKVETKKTPREKNAAEAVQGALRTRRVTPRRTGSKKWKTSYPKNERGRHEERIRSQNVIDHLGETEMQMDNILGKVNAIKNASEVAIEVVSTEVEITIETAIVVDEIVTEIIERNVKIIDQGQGIGKRKIVDQDQGIGTRKNAKKIEITGIDHDQEIGVNRFMKNCRRMTWKRKLNISTMIVFRTMVLVIKGIFAVTLFVTNGDLEVAEAGFRGGTLEEAFTKVTEDHHGMIQ
mmetsp:Transcript_45648/g.67345  ORF Transcript_45648/g.67345 Transcript_45648/m.67345 type:complete len:274 (+) Transcript_45648:787-1608(+)